MIWKLKLFIYYALIRFLPHSRFCMMANRIRVWYLCRVLKIMKAHTNNYFEPGVYISDGYNLRIGSCCHINENVFIQGAEIGNCVMIAPNTAILNTSHRHDAVDVPIIDQGELPPENPVIEDDVWIGRNVTIMPGVRIGAHSIVGAGAVVTQDILPYSIAGGVPARIIKERR